MSMKKSGCLRRAGTSPAAIRSPGAAVDVSTTSTSPSFAATSSSPSALPPKRAASAAPASGVRFATYAIEAPRAERLPAASSPMRPAPTSMTLRPFRSPKTWAASAAAAAGTDAGLSPIAVSVRTSLPSFSAWRNTRSSSGPGEAASKAARTWPRISLSPGISESSPAETRKRCSAAASSCMR